MTSSAQSLSASAGAATQGAAVFRLPPDDVYDAIIRTSHGQAAVAKAVDAVFGTSYAGDVREAGRIFFLGIKTQLADGPVLCFAASPLYWLLMADPDVAGRGVYCQFTMMESDKRAAAKLAWPHVKPMIQAPSTPVANVFLALGEMPADSIRQCGPMLEALGIGRIRAFISGCNFETILNAMEGLDAEITVYPDPKHSMCVETDAHALTVMLDAAAQGVTGSLIDAQNRTFSYADLQMLVGEINSFASLAGIPWVETPSRELDVPVAAKKIIEGLFARRDFAFGHKTLRFLAGYGHVIQMALFTKYISGVKRYLPGNRTLALAMRDCRPGALCPKPLTLSLFYDGYYRFRGREMMALSHDQKGVRQPFRFSIGASDAGIRIIGAASCVEYILHRLRDEFPGEKIRWLDIGCGQGEIMNLADPARAGIADFEFVGVDSSVGSIYYANQNAGPNRIFHVGNAFKLPPEIGKNGFHLVTAFEFLEHIEDPVSLLQSAARMSKAYLLGGSPANEFVTPYPGVIHMWSFERDGFANIFQAAGLNLVMAQETLVGKFSRGHDWLNCIARVNESAKAEAPLPAPAEDLS